MLYLFPVVVYLSDRGRYFFRKVREESPAQAANKAFRDVDVIRAKTVGRDALADRGDGKKNLIAVSDGNSVRRFEELNGSIQETTLEEHKGNKCLKDFLSAFEISTRQQYNPLRY